MFVAAVGGVVGGALVGAIIHEDHSNHGNHANYSEYNDAALTDQIRQKEAEYEHHRRMKSRLEQELNEEFQIELENLEADNDIRPLLNQNVSGEGIKKFENMSKAALQKLDGELEASLAKDKQRLQEIDKTIQRINALTLSDKGGNGDE